MFCYLWCLLVLLLITAWLCWSLVIDVLLFFACCFVLGGLLWVFIVYLFDVYGLVDRWGWF